MRISTGLSPLTQHVKLYKDLERLSLSISDMRSEVYPPDAVAESGDVWITHLKDSEGKSVHTLLFSSFPDQRKKEVQFTTGAEIPEAIKHHEDYLRNLHNIPADAQVKRVPKWRESMLDITLTWYELEV